MQVTMLVSRMWSWVCLNVALILSLGFNDRSKARQAMLVGTVYCDPCFRQIFSESRYFISGASVAVECGAEPRFREQVRTDEKGEFRVKLPFSVSKHVGKIEGCFVKLISSGESDCAVAATATSSSIRLKAKTPEKHVFTAGSLTFRPIEQQKECYIKARNWDSDDEVNASPPLPSPATHGKEATKELDSFFDADTFGLPYPPNPFRKPLLDSSYQPPPDSMLDPIPFQPPPASIFNSIPFQPPPDSLFGPLPLQPSPPSFFPQLFTPPPPSSFPSLQFPPVAPLPNLIQSPPLPSSMPPPFPPFPFQPSPGLPGMPPATASAHPIKTSSP